MPRNTDANGSRTTAENKPYALLGAGLLTASIWKDGDADAGWRYRFNVFRLSRPSGRVTQRFRPEDVADLARLAQLLAVVLSDDGCLEAGLRRDLSGLADRLDQALSTTTRKNNGNTDDGSTRP